MERHLQYIAQHLSSPTFVDGMGPRTAVLPCAWHQIKRRLNDKVVVVPARILPHSCLLL